MIFTLDVESSLAVGSSINNITGALTQRASDRRSLLIDPS
jgi:hypothetical protein